MGRPRSCACGCGPPDCFGCNPVRDPLHVPLAFRMDWSGPTWGMPTSQVNTISGLMFSFPYGFLEAGQQQWNCGSWYPPPPFPGTCNLPVHNVSLETRWDCMDPSVISGVQYLCKQNYNVYTYTNPSPCHWATSVSSTIIQYSHNGYLARGVQGGALISGPSAWATEVRPDVVQPGNPLAGLGCKRYEWDGVDSGAGLYNGASSPRLWSLNTSRPFENGFMGWTRAQGSFNNNLSIVPAIRNGNYHWMVTATLLGARSWRTSGTRLTGAYAGYNTGPAFGSSDSLVYHGAVSPAAHGGKVPLGGWTLNYMNDYYSVHPTQEIAVGIQSTPSSIPPGCVQLGPGVIAPGVPTRYNLVKRCTTTYISDNPINCVGDLAGGDTIPFSLDTSASAVEFRTRNVITFGTTWPATFTGFFIPNP